MGPIYQDEGSPERTGARVTVTTTAARPVSADSCHWYFSDGRPCYEVPRASGEGMRPTTLADGRKLNLLPSVTTILRVLNKPALNDWLIENAVLACLTTPQLKDEPIDAFVHRVMHVERVQDQESIKAMGRGTEIHEALELLFSTGRGVSPELMAWVEPVYTAIKKDSLDAVERILVGEGYAGKCDLIQSLPGEVWLWDFKSTKTLPKSAWLEHRLQLAAYAAALQRTEERHVRTANAYISTVKCGEFVLCPHPHWGLAYDAFKCLFQFWCYANEYHP